MEGRGLEECNAIICRGVRPAVHWLCGPNKICAWTAGGQYSISTPSPLSYQLLQWLRAGQIKAGDAAMACSGWGEALRPNCHPQSLSSSFDVTNAGEGVWCLNNSPIEFIL